MQWGSKSQTPVTKKRKVSTAVEDKILGTHPQKTHRRQCINADARTGLAKVIRARALVFVRDGNVHFPLSSLAAAAAVGATFPSSQPASHSANKQTFLVGNIAAIVRMTGFLSLTPISLSSSTPDIRYCTLFSLILWKQKILPRQQLTCLGALILKENTPDTCFSSHEPSSRRGKRAKHTRKKSASCCQLFPVYVYVYAYAGKNAAHLNEPRLKRFYGTYLDLRGFGTKKRTRRAGECIRENILSAIRNLSTEKLFHLHLQGWLFTIFIKCRSIHAWKCNRPKNQGLHLSVEFYLMIFWIVI